MHYVWPFYNIMHERVKYHVSVLVKCKICMFSNWNIFASSSKRIRFIFFTILWRYCFWKMRDLCFTRFTKTPILSSCRNQPFDLIYLNELTGFCMIDWFQMFFKNVERKSISSGKYLVISPGTNVDYLFCIDSHSIERVSKCEPGSGINTFLERRRFVWEITIPFYF